MVRAVGTPASWDDRELWAAAVDGDAEAFARLFDRYADVVYRYAVVRLRDPIAAEEIVSTVFLEVWKQRHRIDLRDGLLRPWLLGVARNQVNRSWRQQARLVPAPQIEDGATSADHAAAVAAGVDAQQELERVLDAVSELPDEPRETLILHVWGELSHDQVASELGVSVGTVKSRLHRARSRLASARDAHRGTAASTMSTPPTQGDGPLELGA